MARAKNKFWMAKPQLHILIGLPGSGKSTWVAKYIAGRDPAPVVLSLDDQIDEMAAETGGDYNSVLAETNVRALTAALYRDLRTAVLDSRDIIIDQTHMSAKSRCAKLAMVPERYTKTAVLFVVPDQVLRQRLDERQRATGKCVGWEVINRMARKYDAPTRKEFDKIIYVR